MHLRNEVLARYRTIAVVGFSPNPDRPSNEVARYMQAHGYRIVPVNPNCAGQTFLGERCHASLTEAAAALGAENIDIDIVDCFRKSEEIPAIVDDAIRIGANCIWMQLGVSNPEAARRAEQAGLIVVQDRCIKLDHMHVTSVA